MTGQSVDSLPYRPCVGIVLFNQNGLVFAARRIDTPGDAWQLPQGGIDPGETPAQAALREMAEEIGTGKGTIIDETAEWLCYDLPPELRGKVWKGRFRGQKQKWFALRFTGRDADIDIGGKHAEFSDWRWMPLEALPPLIVPFKRVVYEAVAARFAHLAEAVRQAGSS